MFFLKSRAGARATSFCLVADVAIDPRNRWAFTDLARRFVTSLENCALTWLADRHHDDADATVTLERDVLTRLVLRELSTTSSSSDADRSGTSEPGSPLRRSLPVCTTHAEGLPW